MPRLIQIDCGQPLLKPGWDRQGIPAKKTTPIGDHLYLVQAAVRWALYDLLTGTVTLMDENSGMLLEAVGSIGAAPADKTKFLKQSAVAVWDLLKRSGTSDRLFHRDTSTPPRSVQLDLLWLEITDLCNEKCVHCYAECGPMRKTRMGLKFAKTIIRQGHNAGFRKLQLSGGEPLTHADLWEMVTYAHQLNYPEIEIYTNLTLATKAHLDLMRRLNVKVATTLLGHNARVHNSCTRAQHSFEHWYSNIKYAQTIGLEYRIGVIRLRENEDSMEEIDRFLRKEGLLSPDQPFEPDDLRPTGRGNDASIFPTTPLDYNLHLTVNSRFFHQSSHYNPCWKGEIAVSTDGTVFPCVFSRQLSAGNLRTEPLRSILDRLKCTYWSITLEQVDKCRDCEFRHACMDCRALSVNAGKGLYGAPVRCDYDPYR